MMPDLGKYAAAVLSAYGVTIALLVAIVGLSVMRERRVRRDLEDAEARRKTRMSRSSSDSAIASYTSCGASPSRISANRSSISARW